MKTERYKFTKEEIQKLMYRFLCKTPEEALEEWAYREFGMKHNASITTGKIGKTFIEIVEVK